MYALAASLLQPLPFEAVNHVTMQACQVIPFLSLLPHNAAADQLACLAIVLHLSPPSDTLLRCTAVQDQAQYA